MSSSGVYYSWQVLYMKISHQSHIEQYTKKESIQQVCQYLRVERPSGKDEWVRVDVLKGELLSKLQPWCLVFTLWLIWTSSERGKQRKQCWDWPDHAIRPALKRGIHLGYAAAKETEGSSDKVYTCDLTIRWRLERSDLLENRTQ